MKEIDIKNSLRKLGYHCRILLFGFARTILGTLIVLAIALSIYGLWSIPKEGGYAAVFDFVMSCVLLTIAGVSMYILGLPGKINTKKKGGK